MNPISLAGILLLIMMVSSAGVSYSVTQPKQFTASIDPLSSTVSATGVTYTITITNPLSNGLGPQIGCAQINIPNGFSSPSSSSITSPPGKNWQAQLINSGPTIQINAISGTTAAGKIVSGESVSVQIAVINTFRGPFTWTTAAFSNPECQSADFAIFGSQPTVTIFPAKLDHFTVDSPSGPIATQIAGVPFNVRITAQDAFGNTDTAFTGRVSLSNLLGGISPTKTDPFIAGVRIESVTLTKAGIDKIIATGSGSSGASNTFTVNPAAAASISVTPAVASDVVVTGTQAFTGKVLDTFGNERTFDSSSIAWTASGGTVSPSPASSTTFTAGTTAGPASVTASFTDLTSVTRNFNLLPGTASKLVVTDGTAQTLTAGADAASAQITVEQRDANNNPVTAGASGVTVNLSTTSSGGQFSAKSSPFSSITSVKISNGASSASFFYKDTLAGTPTLTASSGSLTSATTTFTVNFPGTITILKKDPLGNLVTTAGATFTITPNPLTGSGSLTVIDNGAGDTDNTIGSIKVNALFGTYAITEVLPPPGFVLPSNPSQTNLVFSSSTPNLNLVSNFSDAIKAIPTTTVLNPTEGITLATPVIEQVSAGQTVTVEIPETPTQASVSQLDIISNSNCNEVSLNIVIRDNVPPGVSPPPVSVIALYLQVIVNNCEGFTVNAPTTIFVQVDKNLAADQLPDGCPVVVFSLLDNTNTWVPLTVTRNPQADSGSQCGYTGQTPHLSKFSVGGIKSTTSRSTIGSGGYDANAIVDESAPTIQTIDWNPTVASAGGTVTINAQILDDVGVDKAVVFYYGPDEDARKAHAVSMKPLNNEWFTADVKGSPVSPPGFHFWVVTTDGSGNADKSDIKEVKVQQGAPIPPPPLATTTLPANVLAAIKPIPVTPTQKLEVTSMKGGKEIKSLPDKILIRNTGNITADNIRIMLSPEIAKNFRLSHSMINSIKPHSNVTINLELVGGQNKDVFGGLMGYSGDVMVMGEHLSPITLAVNIAGEQSNSLSSFMDKVAGMAEHRYSKLSLINSLLSKHPNIQSNYEVTTSNKDNVITKPSGDIVIKNLSDKELKNIRIAISGAGNIFLLDNKVIHHLDAHGQVTIRMIPTIDTRNYSPRDIKGELLIVPSNDNPIFIPLNIPAVERKDSANEFEANTMKGNNSIFTAADKIVIKNNGNRTMDSVTLRLSNNLARVATLSKDSFQHIESNGKVIVEFKYNADLKTNANLKTFMQDYKGELIIASEHHNIRSIPVSVEWKEISSKHFTIYSRSGDEQTARQVIDLLESNYEKITSRFGEMKHKTVIYMTNSMDEMKLVNPSGHPYYSYIDDAVFVCASDDPKYNALKEFIYRLVINNYPDYYNMKKLTFDKENWLLDGVSSYVAAKITDTEMVRKYIDAFTIEPASFQWYGYGSDAKYGAVYTFFEYLHEKYGDKVIDRTLYHLGSGMVSNHRCDTLENCAVLRAVYDVNGWSMHKSYRHTVDVNTLVSEWEGYVTNHYGNEVIVKETSIDGHYDLSVLNTFQKVEVMKAFAKQSAGMPLTPTEEAVLDLTKTKNAVSKEQVK